MVDPQTAIGIGTAAFAFDKLGGRELTLKFLGPTVDYLGDRLKVLIQHGAENLKSIFLRARQIHADRGVENNTVPLSPRYTLQFIEGAVLEDDTHLQDMWAGLLANSTDPEKRLSPNKLYMNVLSNLEPLDVAIMKFLMDKGWLQLPTIPEGGITLKQISEGLGVSQEDAKISVLNLSRLECIVAQKKATWDTMDGIKSGLILEDDMFFRVSSLGSTLLSACQA
jgi:hypothetical protein